MNLLLVILRLIHIVSGVVWVGFAAFTAFYLLPAVQDTGPEGGKVMAALQRRGLVTILPLMGFATVAAGFWLYWLTSSGFDRTYMGSTLAMTLGVGAVLAIVALVLGIAVTRPSIMRAGAIMTGLGSITSDQERQVQLAEANRLRARAAAAGRWVAILLLGAAGAMAVARYL